jgi:hypothetical protein
MSDLGLAMTLLNHIGSPSMMVTGRKSGLPAGDRVGIMLNNISPSLAARLARKTVGRPRGPANVRTSTPSLAQDLHARAKHLRAETPQPGHIQPAGAAGCSLPARPIRPCTAVDRPRQFSPDNEPACLPPEPRSAPSHRTWPWNQQLPAAPASPECVTVYVRTPAPALGELIDLFA